ncbi:MAG: hypothetical protein FWC96_08985 [Oscillospiraceae bacterium]|nr:hypothetical protein [Oscillospiraceae bacterium]
MSARYGSNTSANISPSPPNKPGTYQIGSIRLEGVTPSDSFLEFAEKERLGVATDEDVLKICPRGYFVPEPE